MKKKWVVPGGVCVVIVIVLIVLFIVVSGRGTNTVPLDNWPGEYVTTTWEYDVNGVGTYEKTTVKLVVTEKDENLNMDFSVKTLQGHTRGMDGVLMNTSYDTAVIPATDVSEEIRFSVLPLPEGGQPIWVEVRLLDEEQVEIRYAKGEEALQAQEYVVLGRMAVGNN